MNDFNLSGIDLQLIRDALAQLKVTMRAHVATVDPSVFRHIETVESKLEQLQNFTTGVSRVVDDVQQLKTVAGRIASVFIGKKEG